VQGRADAPVTRADLALVEALLPADEQAAATASVALMELGRSSARPGHRAAPPAPCRTRAPGWPPDGPDLAAPVRRPQGYAGSDRQVRGRLLAVLREAPAPVEADRLAQAWDEPVQRARALDGLVADGLVDPLPDGRYALPGTSAAS
jgi:A/G-specific adenine glycosylase